MKSFKLIDVSTKNTLGNIACGTIPMIGSKLKIITESEDCVFRVRDLEYIVYEGNDDFDVVILVSKE